MITIDDIDALAMPREQILQHASDAGDVLNDTEALSRVQAAIDYAVGVVRSAYSKANLPSPSANDHVVKTVCVDIALYRIVSRRPGEIVKSIAKNYADALSFLESLFNASGSDETTLVTFTREPDLINRFNSMP